jgi:NAD(P)-dependent dehydrogenase (short-subunit alcohol dehydrogenase family)
MSDLAIVTGGASGIGAAIARRLTEDGMRVIVVDRAPVSHAYAHEVVTLDLADAEATQSTLARAIGDRHVTRLVNNAGLVMPATLEETGLLDIDAVAAVNLRAPIICMQAVLPGMKAAGMGRVVNISSRVALGKELRTAYSATKAGLHGMTKTWALELGGHGITVNAIGPGPIETDMLIAANDTSSPQWEAYRKSVPVGRLGKPEDIANGVSFFLDDRSSFVTGQVLYICGGLSVGRGGIT